MTNELNFDKKNQLNSSILTVCIPTYNRSQALDNCLFAVCTQIDWDKLPVEVIVSDNYSEDRTQDVALKWMEKFKFVKYYKNSVNIGGVKNFWKVSEYVNTPYFWLLGDDNIIIPGAIKHIIDILQNYPNTSLIILGGNNDIANQAQPIQKLIKDQKEIVNAGDKHQFLCSFWLQTIGWISVIVYATQSWRYTNYNQQHPEFICPQIRSVIEICKYGQDILFSNRLCVLSYRADRKHNAWYLDQAPISIVIEFPWLQEYAKSLGFSQNIDRGMHRQFFGWKLKQWVLMILRHPRYSALYSEAIRLEKRIFYKILMLLGIISIFPFKFAIKKYLSIS